MAEEVRRGDIRLYRFPAPDKERPVVVLTRSSALRYLTYVTIAPITSTIRDIPTEVVLDEEDGMKKRCAVNLDHVITVPRSRLGRRVTALQARQLTAIAHAIAFALDLDLSAENGDP
jgi:mRNA interferase MazF